MIAGTRVDEISKAFGGWVKGARSDAGLSQQALADLIGRRQQTVTQIEQGARPATVSEVYRILTILGRDLPTLDVELQTICTSCWGSTPAGFTCNACGSRS